MGAALSGEKRPVAANYALGAVTLSAAADSVARMEGKGRFAWPDWRLIAALIGVIGVARAALGLQVYPCGDDMVYGPLARLAADPSLYPGDVQLAAFENHAWVYSLIWRASDATIGVTPAHLTLTIALTFAAGLLMLAIMRTLGVAGWFAPFAFVLASLASQRGIGRGDYGGAIGDHFHLQSLACVLCLAAFLAVLRHRWALAGAALGLAALAQPALAAQGAVAAACGALALGRGGLRPVAIMALVSIIVATPMTIRMWGAPTAAEVDTASAIADGYIWRAGHHYLIPFSGYLVFALYAAFGLAGCRNAVAVGIVGGLAVSGVLCFLIFADPLGLGVGQVSVIPYMLDLSRSSPLLWVMGAAMGAAGMEQAWTDRKWSKLFAPGLAAAALIALNFEFEVLSLAAFALAAFVALAGALCIKLVTAGIAAVGISAVIWSIIAAPPPLDRDPALKGFYEWALQDTAPDSLFIAPPMVADIRELARRAVWVDFRAVSMAQPDQTMLSRRRHEMITPNFADLPDIGGWDGAYIWTVAYSDRHDRESITALLDETGASYFVTFRTEKTSKFADDGLKTAYADDHTLVFRRSDP